MGLRVAAVERKECVGGACIHKGTSTSKLLRKAILNLHAAVAALGMFYPARNVLDPDVQYWSIVRLLAKVPTIIAAYYCLRQGG